MNPSLHRKVIYILVCFIPLSVSAQTFTMSKSCRESVQKGRDELTQKKFDVALATFESMKGSCKSKDGVEAAAVGRAEALNNLGRHEEAVKASQEALKVSKNKSLAGYFQLGWAQNKLGKPQEAQASLAKIIELTEKNKNVKERASNYALMAALQDRQLGNRDSAMYYLDKAIATDSTNMDFYIQKGDMYIGSHQYDDAFDQYDKAVAGGRTDLDMYIIRSNGRLKMLEDKYKTKQAQQLRSQMTATEKTQVCTELQKAISLGMKDMNKEMFASLVCK